MEPAQSSRVLVIDVELKFVNQKSNKPCVVTKLANLNQCIFAGIVILNQFFEISEVV